jgi:hypothetical protein
MDKYLKELDLLLHTNERIIEQELTKITALANFNKISQEDQYSLVKYVGTTVLSGMNDRMPKLLDLMPIEKIIDFSKLKEDLIDDYSRVDDFSLSKDEIILLLTRLIFKKLFIYDHEEEYSDTFFEENKTIENSLFSDWVTFLLTGKSTTISEDVESYLYNFVSDLIKTTQDSTTKDEIAEVIFSIINTEISNLWIDLNNPSTEILKNLVKQINTTEFINELTASFRVDTNSYNENNKDLPSYLEDKIIFFLLDRFKGYLLEIISQDTYREIMSDLERLYEERSNIINSPEVKELENFSLYVPLTEKISEFNLKYKNPDNLLDLPNDYMSLKQVYKDLIIKRNKIGMLLKDSYNKNETQIGYKKTKKETQEAVEILSLAGEEDGGITLINNLKANYKLRINELKTDLTKSIIKDLNTTYNSVKNESSKIFLLLISSQKDIVEIKLRENKINDTLSNLKNLVSVRFNEEQFRKNLAVILEEGIAQESELFFNDKINNLIRNNKFSEDIKKLMNETISGIEVEFSMEIPSNDKFITSVIKKSTGEIIAGSVSSSISTQLAAAAGAAVITSASIMPVLGLIIGVNVMKSSIERIITLNKDKSDIFSLIIDKTVDRINLDVEEAKQSILLQLNEI